MCENSMLITNTLTMYFRIQWYGSHPPITASCSSDLWASSASKITRDSTSPTKYRHFAYDLTHKIIYFCDLNPYKEGMFCYCSDRSDPEKNVWNGKYKC